MRNLGISDHGLIRELSSPLAGSLYSGEGHSRIYEDEAVYKLAVEYALETSGSFDNVAPIFQGLTTRVATSTTDIAATGAQNTSSASCTNNPYILPFAMRGLLEEDYVKTEMYEEITELIRKFDDWKPSTKVVKDVKFRLEGVRSKL